MTLQGSCTLSLAFEYEFVHLIEKEHGAAMLAL